MISSKFSLGKNGCKYFITYKDNKKVKPFCIMLSKIGWYAKSFGETKHMYILIKEDKFLWKI